MGYSVKYLSCVKVCLILLNILLFVSIINVFQICSFNNSRTLQAFGMVLMGIGIWLRVDPKMYEPTTYIPTDNYIAAAFIMMITGFIIVIVGFYGCYGAVVESQGCLCFVSLFVQFMSFSFKNWVCNTFLLLYLHKFISIMSFMIAAEITGVVLAACRGFGHDVRDKNDIIKEVLTNNTFPFFTAGTLFAPTDPASDTTETVQ